MSHQLTKEKILDVAREVNHTLSGSDGWPDCHNASGRIRQRLVNQFGVNERHVQVREYMLPDEYGHYAVYVSDEVLGESLIIDASFAQFAEETEAPVSVAPRRDIEDVVVVKPASRYVFTGYETLN